MATGKAGNCRKTQETTTHVNVAASGSHPVSLRLLSQRVARWIGELLDARDSDPVGHDARPGFTHGIAVTNVHIHARHGGRVRTLGDY